MYFHRIFRLSIQFVLVVAAGFLVIGIKAQAKQTIMPSIPHGIHIKYSATSQEYALPKEIIEQMITSAQRIGGDPSVLKQCVDGAQARAVNGPRQTAEVEYWGTMRDFVYIDSSHDLGVAYDGEKFALGGASDILPHYVKPPNNCKRPTRDTFPLLG